MKKTDPRFEKFANKKSNAAKKEAFRQEKRKYKKERAEFFDKQKSTSGQRSAGTPNRTSTKEARPISRFSERPVEKMPLNKYLAHSGISSRRDAAELVKTGKVKVNNEPVLDPGYKVKPGDSVFLNGKELHVVQNMVYILLNKPKDYLTTTSDPQKRKTVLDLIRNAGTERVYPVGRLDRNTSGVLLLTNDGDLAQKLSHPSNEVRKIYSVTLDKPLGKVDFDKILKGVILEDGPAPVDALAINDPSDSTRVGLEIHSGRNRIVRRIFESLGYKVKNLDRVMFAGLTKKNIERGRYRFLTENEIRNLKYLGKGKKSNLKKTEPHSPAKDSVK